MKLIIGLGNPEGRFKNTRHNIGFEVIDKISEKLNSSFNAGKGEYLIGEVSYKGNDILMVKPLTYMNNSGIAAKDVINRYKISADDLLVICDDVNLRFGKIRFRRKGGDSGNKGLESVIYHLESVDFSRLRIGVGKENMDDDLSHFVLSKFSKKEEDELKDIIELSAEGAIFWTEYGINEAMNKFNNYTIE